MFADFCGWISQFADFCGWITVYMFADFLWLNFTICEFNLREARQAVRWGMDLAFFFTPQIKRILSAVNSISPKPEFITFIWKSLLIWFRLSAYVEWLRWTEKRSSVHWMELCLQLTNCLVGVCSCCCCNYLNSMNAWFRNQNMCALLHTNIVNVLLHHFGHLCCKL